MIELENSVENVKRKRSECANLTEQISTLEETIKERLGRDEIYQKHLKLLDYLTSKRSEKLKDTGDAENKLREDAIKYYQKNSETKQLLGGSIAETKVHNYDDVKVLEWARVEAPAVISMSLNKKALKAIAETLDVPTYEITSKFTFRIKKEL